MMRRRRPLLRAAAVAGGAYVAGKRVANRQADEDMADAQQDARISQLEQQQAAAPTVPAPSPQPAAEAVAQPAQMSIADQLSKLNNLHSQGMLTDEEFSAAKAKVLGI